MHAVNPNLPSADVGAAEPLDADRQIDASRLFGCACEIAVRVDERRIEMQAGIEKRRMESRLPIY